MEDSHNRKMLTVPHSSLQDEALLKMSLTKQEEAPFVVDVKDILAASWAPELM